VTCLAVAALFALAAPGDSLMLGDIPLQGLTPLVHALMKALTVLSLCLAVYVWQNRYWRAAGRVHYTLVVLAAGAFVWVANYWHLMHW